MKVEGGVQVCLLLPFFLQVYGKETTTTNTTATERLLASEKSSISFVFPSSRATQVTSPFDSGTLFASDTLSNIYPEFEAPHHIQDDFFNTCPNGIDQVTLDLPATAENMLDETVVSFALLINGYYVAETSVSRTRPDIFMQDVVYPPIMDSILRVKLVVVAFDGQVDNSVPPSGVTPSVNENSDPTLTFSCAAPFAVRGRASGKSRESMAIRPQTRRILGSLGDGYINCRVNQRQTTIQYLPDNMRTEALFPHSKVYQDCLGESTKRVLLPSPNEDFLPMSHAWATYFFVAQSKFGVGPVPYHKIRAMHDEICGGAGQGGTIRLSHLSCNRVPSGGGNHLDVTADFKVYCPKRITVKKDVAIVPRGRRRRKRRRKRPRSV